MHLRYLSGFTLQSSYSLVNKRLSPSRHVSQRGNTVTTSSDVDYNVVLLPHTNKCIYNTVMPFELTETKYELLLGRYIVFMYRRIRPLTLLVC